MRWTIRHFNSVLLASAMLGLAGCSKLEVFEYEPRLAAADWCQLQPCMELFGQTISQPGSSLLVLVLALLSMFVGYRFIRDAGTERSKFWWGISLLLGGIGALFAGISYQAFGYEIKCVGREFCLWTSWWEIAYELATVFGASALLLAVSYSCFKAAGRKIAFMYSLLNALVYAAIISIGIYSSNRFLISFEMMVLFTMPAYVLILIVNVFQFIKQRDALLGAYICAWLLLFATLGAYFAYMASGLTQRLWQQGIWFSDNDVLHIGMLLWIVFVWKKVGRLVRDLNSDCAAI